MSSSRWESLRDSSAEYFTCGAGGMIAAEEQPGVDPIELMGSRADEQLLSSLIATYMGGPGPVVVPEVDPGYADDRRMVALLRRTETPGGAERNRRRVSDACREHGRPRWLSMRARVLGQRVRRVRVVRLRIGGNGYADACS